MKLEYPEKITIAVLGVLIIWAVLCGVAKYRNSNSPVHHHIIVMPGVEEKPLPADIQKLSNKYRGYENLYNSGKKVFTYGWLQYTLEKDQGEKFHKALQAKLAEAKLNYEIIPYKNWPDYDSKIERSNSAVYEGDDSKCMMDNPSVQELDTLRDTSAGCLRNACIIDGKNNKYIVISRDIDYIINTLKEHNAD